MLRDDYQSAAKAIEDAKYAVAFTGAGISVESGIPTFRGPTGLWSRYDPKILDLGYFTRHPKESWSVIKEIFYDYMGENAKPNDAHRFLAKLESIGKLKGVITQNIDNLHQYAGSENVVEFHGTAKRLVCMDCREIYDISQISLDSLPPLCPKCSRLLKPDFIFFGEAIPPEAYAKSQMLISNADLMIIVGTTGEVAPASYLPYENRDATVIEINIEESAFTPQLTDIFLRDKASIASKKLAEMLTLEL